jgi:hypothetical protein
MPGRHVSLNAGLAKGSIPATVLQLQQRSHQARCLCPHEVCAADANEIASYTASVSYEKQ